MSKYTEFLESAADFLQCQIPAEHATLFQPIIDGVNRALPQPGMMAKGLQDVGNLASILMSLKYVQSSSEYEALREGDGSTVHEDLLECIEDLGDVLRDMVDEELDELVEPTEDGVVTDVYRAAGGTGDLKKDGVVDPPPVPVVVAKKGAKFSASTKDALGKCMEAHKSFGDHLDALNFEVGGRDEEDDEENDDDMERAIHAGDLAKAQQILKDRVAKLGSKFSKESEGHLDGMHKALKSMCDALHKATDGKFGGKLDEKDDDEKDKADKAMTTRLAKTIEAIKDDLGARVKAVEQTLEKSGIPALTDRLDKLEKSNKELTDNNALLKTQSDNLAKALDETQEILVKAYSAPEAGTGARSGVAAAVAVDKEKDGVFKAARPDLEITDKMSPEQQARILAKRAYAAGPNVT